MNVIKPVAFYSVVFFMLFNSIIAHAKNETVVYRCPTIKEISTLDIRTTINNKDVHWKKNNTPIHSDRVVEFKKVILKQKNTSSYDMSVTCFYRTEANQKLILKPVPSWHWYVDGVAEKIMGNNWLKYQNGNFECHKSVADCLFIFR